MIKKDEFIFYTMPCTKAAAIYYDPETESRACLLYFHGGGLVYGSKDDLPALHLQTLCEQGFRIIAFDYPLAPQASIGEILEDVIASVNAYIQGSVDPSAASLPFFLWGRSAGAYLCLLALASGRLQAIPRGLLSFYGYGLLTDHWFDAPSPHYCQLPSAVLPSAFLSQNPAGAAQPPVMKRSLEEGFSLYVYGRQTGMWPKLLYHEPMKSFYQDYSLRFCDTLPASLFCAHSIGDPDVPFAEFSALREKYAADSFISSGTLHDFDRIESSSAAKRLLRTASSFLERHL